LKEFANGRYLAELFTVLQSEPVKRDGLYFLGNSLKLYSGILNGQIQSRKYSVKNLHEKRRAGDRQV